MGEIHIFTLPCILMRDAHAHLQSSSRFHESFTHLQLLPSPHEWVVRICTYSSLPLVDGSKWHAKWVN